MVAHADNAWVLEQGLAVLVKLSVDDENKRAIVRAGGIFAVVAAMGHHTPIAGVQAQGCAALRNLALNDDNRTAIGRGRGIVAVVAGLVAHTSVSGVQQVGKPNPYPNPNPNPDPNSNPNSNPNPNPGGVRGAWEPCFQQRRKPLGDRAGRSPIPGV